MLRAFGHLTESARLAIAGMGPLQDELLQLSRQLGFEKRVHFLGFQTDVLRWLQAADAFVLCSLWEGLPITHLCHFFGVFGRYSDVTYLVSVAIFRS